MNTKENIFYNFMGGNFYENKSDKLIDIKSPLDGSLVGRIQSLSKEDVDTCALYNCRFIRRA